MYMKYVMLYVLSTVWSTFMLTIIILYCMMFLCFEKVKSLIKLQVSD